LLTQRQHHTAVRDLGIRKQGRQGTFKDGPFPTRPRVTTVAVVRPAPIDRFSRHRQNPAGMSGEYWPYRGRAVRALTSRGWWGVLARKSSLETLGRALATAFVKPEDATAAILPMPQSLWETFRPDVELHAHPNADGNSIEVQGDDPALPVRSLKRIEWPPDRQPPPDVTHYSLDGRPPF